MSRSDRDQRHRPRSGKGCPDSRIHGCDYCITGEYKRPERQRERREAKQQIKEDHG